MRHAAKLSVIGAIAAIPVAVPRVVVRSARRGTPPSHRWSGRRPAVTTQVAGGLRRPAAWPASCTASCTANCSGRLACATGLRGARSTRHGGAGDDGGAHGFGGGHHSPGDLVAAAERAADTQDRDGEVRGRTLRVLAEHLVPGAVEAERGAQGVLVAVVEADVVVAGVCGHVGSAALDLELVSEERVRVIVDHVNDELVIDPVERDVPQRLLTASGVNSGGPGGTTPGGAGTSATARWCTRRGKSAASA